MTFHRAVNDQHVEVDIKYDADLSEDARARIAAVFLRETQRAAEIVAVDTRDQQLARETPSLSTRHVTHVTAGSKLSVHRTRKLVDAEGRTLESGE